MNPFPRAAIFCVFSIVPINVVAGPLSDSPASKGANQADSVRVQPRGNVFTPNSADDDAVQKRITIFNEQQGRLDAEFDRALKICRGC